MKIQYLIAVIMVITGFSTHAQKPFDAETIRNAQRNVCTIKIIDPAGEPIALGCGVVLRTTVNEMPTYFVATAFHIVKALTGNEGSKAVVSCFDKNGYLHRTGEMGKEHILWSNEPMDAALLVLPDHMEPVEEMPSNYEFPGLSNLKLIGEPDWGQDIYLFGYRWLDENTFIDILKKGILSVGTSRLPGYEGHLVYLIDNMANKGMSGGLAFTADGTGIGIISSYVYEPGGTFNSEDLSVCLPLTIYFNAMASAIISFSDKIMELKGN